LKTYSLSELSPLIRYAGQVFLTEEDRKKTRIAYDNRLFFAPERGVYAVAGLWEGEIPEKGFLLIRAGTPYRIGAGKEKVAIVSINFDFFGGPGEETGDHALSMTDQEHFDIRRLRENIRFREDFLGEGVRFTPANEAMQGLFNSVLGEYALAEIAYAPAASGLLTALLCLIYRETRLPNAARQSEILKYVAEHMAEDLSNRALAETFHYHPNYISSVVKAQTGHPLHRYLKMLRLRRAEELLLYTGMTVEEVGGAVGYADPSYFSQLFRNTTGRRPTELRGK